jgi:hypothetical protein
MEKYFKSPDQIANLIEHWFLSYYGRDRSTFSSEDTFTLFSLTSERHQKEILSKLILEEHERVILLLKCDISTLVVNTTFRFARLSESGIEFLNYTDFKGHSGYKSLKVDGAIKGLKTNGYTAEFGLRTRDEEIFYWSIPTGQPGFAFWNVTKKCEIIGRKYI